MLPKYEDTSDPQMSAEETRGRFCRSKRPPQRYSPTSSHSQQESSTDSDDERETMQPQIAQPGLPPTHLMNQGNLEYSCFPIFINEALFRCFNNP